MKMKALVLFVVVASLLLSSLVRANQSLESYVTRGFKIDYNYGPKGKHHKQLFYGPTLELTLRECFRSPKTYNDECVRQVTGALGFQIVRSPSMQEASCVTTSKASGLTFYGKTPQEVVRNCKVNARTNDTECERNLNRGCRACGVIHGEGSQTYYLFMDPEADVQLHFELASGTNDFSRIFSAGQIQAPCKF